MSIEENKYFIYQTLQTLSTSDKYYNKAIQHHNNLLCNNKVIWSMSNGESQIPATNWNWNNVSSLQQMHPITLGLGV